MARPATRRRTLAAGGLTRRNDWTWLRVRAGDWLHGKDSWELDALPAPVLAGLVRDALADLAPEDFDERQAEDKATRRGLARRMAE